MKALRIVETKLRRGKFMRGTIIATAIVAGMGTAAHADVMGSAPAFGGSTQTVAVCYYSNLAANNVSITSSVILVEPGNPVAETSESCTGSIQASGRCRTVANIVNNGAHWCRAVVGNKNPLRGRAEFRNSSGGVLTSEAIR